MPIKKNGLSFTKMRSIFFFSLIALLGIAILYIIRPFFYPIFWAAVVAILFYPLYSFLNKYIKMPRLSSTITLVLVFVVIFLPLILISTLIVNESFKVYHSVSQWDVSQQVEGVASWLEQTSAAPHLEKVRTEWTSYATKAAQTVSVFLFENIKSITQNSVRFILMTFIMFYALYYFLKDGPRILKRTMHLSPLGDKYEKMLYSKFTSTARGTLKGTLIVGLIQGSLGGLLFLITGVQGVLIWTIVMIVLSIIPAIGPFLVLLPTGIIMLALGNIWQGVLILAVGILVVGAVDNLLRPPLVGKDIQMHPLLVLFSTLGGLLIFGISGFVIGPIIASLFIAIVSIYDHHYKNELKNN